MQKHNRLLDRDALVFWAGLTGMLAFALCLVLACTMLLVHGNVILLFSWLLASTAAFVFTRFNLRWLDVFERMRTMEGVRVRRRYREDRVTEVEDVIFHEV